MSHWSERREGGNRFWLAFIRWCTLHLGRGFAQCCMYPTALYFFLRRGAERRASRAWLARVGATRRGNIGALIHIYTFAITIVDRVFLLAGRDDELDIRMEGEQALHDHLDRGQGCLLLGSHLGSFEAVRAASRKAPGRYSLKVVMDRMQNSLITSMLEELSPGIRDTVIDARQPGTQIVLEAAETLDRGGMVAMLADRAHGAEPVTEAPFLGKPAPFPISPLAIARSLDVPVFLVFGLYEGRRRYRLVFEPLTLPPPDQSGRTARRQQLNQWVALYAQRLEHHAKQYPYNWFNFYDFWNPGRVATAERHPGGRQS